MGMEIYKKHVIAALLSLLSFRRFEEYKLTVSKWEVNYLVWMLSVKLLYLFQSVVELRKLIRPRDGSKFIPPHSVSMKKILLFKVTGEGTNLCMQQSKINTKNYWVYYRVWFLFPCLNWVGMILKAMSGNIFRPHVLCLTTQGATIPYNICNLEEKPF